MGHSGRVQVFPYSLKTVAVADRQVLTATGNKIGLEAINPVDLYQVEGLAVHLKAHHDATPSNIIGITVEDGSGNIVGTIPLSIAPVAGVVEVSKDISSLRNITGRNLVYINFAAAATLTLTSFKVDMIYTSKGIR